ncbi:MAG: HAD family hydrolase, partial [Candidatus Magasanikbacteria bacterium]|nr:HAD family hydrolase [Candidatus Magasanikbacteria bacterium]
AEYRKLFYEVFVNKENVLMSGVLEILEKAKNKELLMAVTSGGHKKEKLVEILKLHNIYDYFSVIVSSDDVTRGKPAPDVYLEASKKLGQKVDDCLAFEDSPNGVVAAGLAGICVYGINADEKTRNDLIEAGANKVFKSLTEIEL